jgi:hypothetical protein
MKLTYEPYEVRRYSLNEYNKFLEFIEREELDTNWVFRAQGAYYELETSLERAILRSGLSLADAPLIEKTIIREFGRLYSGSDCDLVRSDSLYCLSLLRHFGAPTRLLDFTYSKYVASYFGLEVAYRDVPRTKGKQDYEAPRSFALWCVNTKDLETTLLDTYRTDAAFVEAYRSRANLKTRKEASFATLYFNNYLLASPENPVIIHERLHLQQGVFLCPGSVSETFRTNLLHPYGSSPRIEAIKKLICRIEPRRIQNEFTRFKRMNITRESLFPGLDGQAAKMEYLIADYLDLGTRVKEAGGFGDLTVPKPA